MTARELDPDTEEFRYAVNMAAYRGSEAGREEARRMSLPTPYYDDGNGIVIYCADCLDVLPHLGPVDLVLTDPPYGINWSRGVHAKRNSRSHDGILNDEDTSVRDEVLALLRDTPAIVFGSFYAPFPRHTKQILVWAKTADCGVVGSTTGYRRDAEPVFLVGSWPMQTVKWSSVLRSHPEFRGRAARDSGHTHAKPVDLIRLLIERSPSAGVILDPFMGSGTTLRAAKDLGRRCIGVEIVEAYCEIAVKRLRQSVLALDGIQ